MSGDGFGRDDWPDEQPGTPSDADADHDVPSTTSEPGATEDQFAGTVHDSHDGAIDHDTESGRGRPVDLGQPAIDADFGASDGADPFDTGFDRGDEPGYADDGGAEADDSPAAGATPSLASEDRWAETIGYGAADPAGERPGWFDDVDLSTHAGGVHAEPDWLTDELAAARATWVDPSLLDASAPHDAAPMVSTSGAEAVGGLWARLAPETPMPSDAAGAPDLVGALDVLEARAGATPLRRVVDAARGLLDA